jgi:dTDP-4-dehydrorhamnose reductase
MKNILIIGSVGQIGSELTMELRKRYGNENVVAGYRKTEPSKELAESGPLEMVDATDLEKLHEVVKKYRIDTIYNMAALLSAVAEAKPQAAWNVGVNGVFNVLEVAREPSARQLRLTIRRRIQSKDPIPCMALQK